MKSNHRADCGNYVVPTLPSTFVCVFKNAQNKFFQYAIAQISSIVLIRSRATLSSIML